MEIEEVTLLVLVNDVLKRAFVRSFEVIGVEPIENRTRLLGSTQGSAGQDARLYGRRDACRYEEELRRALHSFFHGTSITSRVPSVGRE